MRTLPALAVLTCLLVPTAASAAPAAPETRIGLDLPRGAALTTPHVEGTTLVDGPRRIPVDAETLYYAGGTGSAYVVVVDDARVVRLDPDGGQTPLGRTYGDRVRVDDTDRLLATTRHRNGDSRRSTVTVRDTTTGATVARRTFPSYVSALDVDATRVLVGGPRRTLLWRTDTGAVSRVSRDDGYAADLATDLVAGFVPGTATDEGACTRLTRISTGAEVGELCDDLVLAFSPDGSRVATTERYPDGPVTTVRVETLRGTTLAAYRSAQPLGRVAFSGGPDTLLLELVGPRRSATVRCTGTACEVAGKPYRSS